MIPNDMTGVIAALNAAYATLGEADAFALAAALERPSPVDTMVAAFDVLRAVPALDDAGLIALAGCARMIAIPSNAWHGRGGDAATLLIERAAAIAALPQPEMPSFAAFVPEAITDLTP